MLNELVYAEVSNKFVTKIDDKTSYSKFQYSLGTYIKPHHFGIPQTKRGTTNFVYDAGTIDKYKTHTGDLRQAIDDFELAVTNTVKHFRNTGIRPTKDQFKERLELIAERKKPIEDVTLVNYTTKRIAYLQSIIGTGMSEAVTKSTIDNMQSVLAGIIKYEKARKTKVTFQNLKAVYWDIWDVMDSIVKGKVIVELEAGEKKKAINKNGIATNTLVNYQSILKQICENAVSEGITVSVNYNDKSLLVKAQTSSFQYDVNNDDLLTIFNHKPSTERLQKAKDYIVFSSLTGMRMQSVLEVVGEPIQSYDKKGIAYDYVHTIQSKTGTSCHTPLFKPAKDIITQNGGNLPDFSRWNATLNKQIKDLYKEAGITYKIPVTKHYYKGGAITEYKSVAEVVSTHATRKGFVTNLYSLGIDTQTAKLVTHPDSKKGTTDSYNKITDTDRALLFYKAVVKNIEDNELYRF